MEKKYALSFLFLFLLACYFNNSNSASFPVTVSDSQQQNWTFTSATSVTDPSGNIYTVNLCCHIPNPQTDIIATLSPDVIPTLYTLDNATPGTYTYNNNYYKKITSLAVAISDSQQQNWTFTSATSVIDPNGNTHDINLQDNVPNPNTDKIIYISISYYSDLKRHDFKENCSYNLCRKNNTGQYDINGTYYTLFPKNYTGDKYTILMLLANDASCSGL